MTSNHAARLYAIAGTAFVLFLSWAVIAAHPWKAAAAANATDSRLVALQQREQLLRRDIALVQKLTARATVARAQSQLASARTAAVAPVRAVPAVKVVTLPPLVITRTS